MFSLILFVSILYIPVNNFQSFLGLPGLNNYYTKQRITFLPQRHYTVPLPRERLEPATRVHTGKLE